MLRTAAPRPVGTAVSVDPGVHVVSTQAPGAPAIKVEVVLKKGSGRC